MISALQGFFVAVAVAMALYTLARSCCGLLDAHRRVTFDNAMLFWHYTVAQGIAGLALVHGVARMLT
jgi:cytochrome c oxidase subunit I+III